MFAYGTSHTAGSSHPHDLRGQARRMLRSLRSLCRTLRTLGVSLVLVVTLLVGANSPLAQGLGIGSPAGALAAPAQGTPHHVDPTSGTKSVLHQPPASKLPPFTPQTQRPPMSHGFVPSMKPGLLKLDPTKDTQFVGSDGRFEIDAPAGAVTAADVAAAAGGTLALRVTEIAPPSGSNAGSAVVSLGSYAVEVVDGQGNHVAQFAHGLRKGPSSSCTTGRGTARSTSTAPSSSSMDRTRRPSPRLGPIRLSRLPTTASTTSSKRSCRPIRRSRPPPLRPPPHPRRLPLLPPRRGRLRARRPRADQRRRRPLQRARPRPLPPPPQHMSRPRAGPVLVRPRRRWLPSAHSLPWHSRRRSPPSPSTPTRRWPSSAAPTRSTSTSTRGD